MRHGTVFLIVICASLLLVACATASAQSAATPTPTPLPPDYPENLRVTAGLERPTLRAPADPGPYIEATWDEPPDRVLSIMIEIHDEDGDGRSPTHADIAGPYGLDLPYEAVWLRNNGCTITSTSVRITGDCLDRYRVPRTSTMRAYPIGFLKLGDYYEVRVIFYSHQRGSGPSATHVVRIPNRTPPTPTPHPTATPRPTATPAPVQVPGPSVVTPPATPTSARELFRNNPLLGAASHFDNVSKQYRSYTQDGWTMGNGRSVRTLTQLVPGKIYFLWVARATTVNGHALTCANSICMNVVVW